MPLNLLSGVTGSVRIGLTSYSFGKWSLDIKANLPKVTNFNTVPFQALVSGIISGTLTVSGPYDQGNMPFTSGNIYVFSLMWTPLIGISVPVLIESIKADNDADGNPTIAITGQTTGAFTPSIT